MSLSEVSIMTNISDMRIQHKMDKVFEEYHKYSLIDICTTKCSHIFLPMDIKFDTYVYQYI